MALEEPPVTRQTFGIGTTIALGVAAYWVVATALKIKYVKGPLSIELNKKAADSATVKGLLQKLLSHLPRDTRLDSDLSFWQNTGILCCRSYLPDQASHLRSTM